MAVSAGREIINNTSSIFASERVIVKLAKDFRSFRSEMLAEIAALMSGVGFDVNMTSCSSGLPPPGHAVFVGHEASVRLLLVCTPTNKTRPHNMTPLIDAARQGRAKCIGLLLGAPGIL